MRNKLKLYAGISYILITILILYFHFMPTIVNSLFTDIIFIILLSSLIITLISSSFQISNKSEVITFLPAALILIFFVRAIPNMLLAYPPFADPYYHFICTINIMDYGTFESNVQWWYPQSDIQLNWPMLHVLTVQLSSLSDLDLMFFFRWLMPFLGTVLFFGVFIFAHRFTNNYGISYLAALIGTSAATTIFYQSEYHPQGLALTLLIFLLFGFFNAHSKKSVSFVVIALLFIFSFTFSHHFSTLFMCTICILAIVLAVITRNIPPLRNHSIFLPYGVTILFIAVISTLSFYLYTNPDLLLFLFDWSLDLTPISGGSKQAQTPLLTAILNSTKWISVTIVIISVPFILYKKETKYIGLLLITFLIFTVGFLSLFFFFMPLDRVFAIVMPLIGTICAISLFKLKGIKINKKILINIAIIIISIAIVGGILGSQSPSYFLKSSELNSYYWYSNDLPDAIDSEISGHWSKKYIESDNRFGVTFASWSIPFYYGRNSVENVSSLKSIDGLNYIVLNKNVVYDGEVSLSEISDMSYQIYSGPNIVYFQVID